MIRMARKMTNTYSDDADYNTKLLEEIRCLRCVMERVLSKLRAQPHML